MPSCGQERTSPVVSRLGQEIGRSKQDGNRLEIGIIWKLRVWMRDALGSEVGGERLKESDEEVLPDPLQRIQTSEPLERAHVPDVLRVLTLCRV